MRNRFVLPAPRLRQAGWKLGLIILLLGISSLALGAKGCLWWRDKDDDDIVSGSSNNPNGSINIWTAMTTTNVPTSRKYHTGVWTGTEMLIWGGSPFPDSIYGSRYKP